SSAAQHSQSLEAWYAHVPGLVVVCPATAADNHALLKAAIRSDDPAVYLEHKNLWGLAGEVDVDAPPARLGAARIACPGRDLTLVTWSAMLHASLAAAGALAAEGIEPEILDLRTLWPWDREAVLASASRTGRLLVVHEAVQAGGCGAEIAATVAEELGVPVRRLGAPRIPIAYSPPLEEVARIGPERIATTIRAMLNPGGPERCEP
ncbi:MAG TPA: transketolase C-terminal domain-containing protein, partial [Geminicoccaceae bacterium]|nr:transketolase C-terminal domain-containing protein [Geminicoccaceae bacterium]